MKCVLQYYYLYAFPSNAIGFMCVSINLNQGISRFSRGGGAKLPPAVLL